MNGPALLWQMLRDRWKSLLAWSLGACALVAVIVAAYPSVRDTARDLDAYVERLPPALQEAFGLADNSVSSPPGYLVSQLYSNIYPIIVIVLAIGIAAWTIAGAEADGTIEATLANPVRRRTLAIWRFVGVAVMVGVVTAVSTGLLVALSPTVALDVGVRWWGPWAAGLSMSAMVMVFASVTFAVGAATGSKALAIAVGASLAALTFLGQVLAALAPGLEWMRSVSPWWWFLQSNPVVTRPGWLSLGLPVTLTLLLALTGVLAVQRRDLRL